MVFENATHLSNMAEAIAERLKLYFLVIFLKAIIKSCFERQQLS